MPGRPPQGSYRGTQYRSYAQETWEFRPLAATTYTAGNVLQNAAADLQVFDDEATVQLSATGANAGQSLVGVVDPAWPGFNGAGLPATFVSPSSLSAEYGTVYVGAITRGFVAGILLDQSGSGAVTVVDKLALIASRATAGYAQGASASAPAGGSAVVANACLASTGFGSSLTAAALVQASQTATVAGTPAAGDVLTVTIQTPWVNSAVGVTQTTPFSVTLNSTTAASVTTAAAAWVAAANANPLFSTFFIATNAAGVITVTVVATSPLFHVNYGPGIEGQTIANQFDISLSGMLANSLTFACSVSGGAGSTLTAGAANLASGTGFKGYIPAFVCATP